MDNGLSNQTQNPSAPPQPPPPQPAPPAPSYAPFLVALGITMIFWGVVTSPVMSAGGLGLFVAGLWMWIGAIAKGWRR